MKVRAKSSTRKQKMTTILWTLLSIYLVAFLVLASAQRTFMYHPTRGSEAAYLKRAKAQNVQPWRDSNEKLIGWNRVLDANAKLLNAQNRLLIFHGNGGDALMRTYFMDGFGALDNVKNHEKTWEFYALEFPGYGWRGENPNQNDILDAAQSALNDLWRRDHRPIYFAGESLGTGVACLLAAKNPDKVRGLFLTTPYTSTTDVAQGHFPMFPVRLVMQDRYEAAEALRHYRGRVVILLAGRDIVVPTHYGQQLFDGYDGPKKLLLQPNAGHNTLDYAPRAAWWKDASAFLLDTRK